MDHYLNGSSQSPGSDLQVRWERVSPAGPVLFRAVGAIAIALVCLSCEAIVRSPGGALFLGLLAMSYINYFVGGRDVLFPAFMYTAIWATVAAAYAFCPIEIDQIGWRTVVFLLAGGASFSAGSLIGNRPLLPTKHTESVARNINRQSDNPQARNILLGCTILVTSLLIIIVLRASGGISGLSLAFLLKLNSPDSPLQDAGLFAALIAGSGGLLPVLTLWVLLMEERRRWKIVLCAICAAVFPLLVTQRGLVMVAFCGCLTLYLLKRKDRTFLGTAKPLSLAGAGIVVLMTLLSYSKSWVQKPGGFTITQGAWMYIAGPIATFNYFIYHPETFKDEPAAVLAQVLTPLSKLGLVRYRTLLEVNGQQTDRFVFVPFPGNVYTAYKPYYEDFGATGCLVAFAFFGFIEGALFSSSNRGNPYAIFFFTYLAGAMMFTTFDDTYHGISRHLNIAVFIIGYFWILKRIRIRI
jgi:oligosaccharide repeat unit polymerase